MHFYFDATVEVWQVVRAPAVHYLIRELVAAGLDRKRRKRV
jgi:hypothetical protein